MLFDGELLSPKAELLEPLDVDQLLASQLMHSHCFVEVGKLVLLFRFLFCSAFFALVVQEYEFWRICVLDGQALDLVLLLSEPLGACLVVVDHRQLVHAVHEDDDGSSLLGAVDVATLQEELVAFAKILHN